MKKSALFLLGIFIICFSPACKKKKNDDCPNCPKIDALIPSSGKKGDTILIKGSNFSNYLVENSVKFNGTVVAPTDMISGSDTELRVRVPGKCGTGPVTVALDDELYSEEGPVFKYTYSASLTIFAGKHSTTGGDSNGGTSFKDLLMNHPTQVGVDASGNVFILDNVNLKVRKLNAATGLAEVLSDNTSLEGPCALAVDENNVLFVSSFSTTAKKSVVYKLTPGSTLPLFYFSDPDANKRHISLSSEGNGQFYIGRVPADYSAVIPQIRHYVPGKPLEAFADSSGNVVAYKNGHLFQIRSIPVGASSTTVLTKYTLPAKAQTTLIKANYGLNQSMGLVMDENGNAYISDTNNNRILKYSANGEVTTVVSVGLNKPMGIAIDKQGNLYVADTFNNCIKKITFE
jgi:hypothetical protein